jgi:hypothetical protein
VLLRLVGGLAIVAAVAAATILLNLTLLDSAESRNDPVGKLSPRAVLVPPAPTATSQPAVRTQHDGGTGGPDD